MSSKDKKNVPIISQTEDFKPEGELKCIITFLGKRLSSALVPLLFISILGFILSALELIKPIFYKIFVDRILMGNGPGWMLPMICGMVAVLIITFFVDAIQSIYLDRIKIKMCISAGGIFMWHVLRLPVDFFFS